MTGPAVHGWGSATCLGPFLIVLHGPPGPAHLLPEYGYTMAVEEGHRKCPPCGPSTKASLIQISNPRGGPWESRHAPLYRGPCLSSDF